MPKMKTNKALAKRLKVTGRGKILRRKAGAGHLKSVKSPKRLRRMRKDTAGAARPVERARPGRGGRGVLNAGGGLVHDSTAEAEYQEALWKSRFAQL